LRNQIKVPDEQRKIFTKNYMPWDYTDDTEMTIGLMKAIMSDEVFSEDLLLQKWTEEYEKGIEKKGFGRNGHGSMRWYFSGEKTIEEIRNFQRNRTNPGNAPAMRSVPIGLLPEHLINEFSTINARATHPNINAIISSQCIARAADFLLIKKGNPKDLIPYCFEKIDLNSEYEIYLKSVDSLGDYENLKKDDFQILCGKQPIETPYFLPGINGVPSDSKFTAGSVLYVLKNSKNTFDALKKSVNLGGDVDSVASISTGIAAGRFGLNSLPKFMLEKVEGKEYFKRLAGEFERGLESKFLT